jgi:hypothetical protein
MGRELLGTRTPQFETMVYETDGGPVSRFLKIVRFINQNSKNPFDLRYQYRLFSLPTGMEGGFMLHCGTHLSDAISSFSPSTIASFFFILLSR